jgi:hypothetical protein
VIRDGRVSRIACSIHNVFTTVIHDPLSVEVV